MSEYQQMPATAPMPTYAAPQAGLAPVPGAGAIATAPLGKVRSTGSCVLLTILTLGFYTLYWYCATHAEMKRHSGHGVGGILGLVLAIFLGIVSPFLSSHEVGALYERRGQRAPVSAATGLWALLLSWFFLIGAIVWFVKTNGALNAYWRSLGAR